VTSTWAIVKPWARRVEFLDEDHAAVAGLFVER
jgi:hypothetical protein